MNKTVKLYNTVGRLADREPFILQDGESFTLDLDCDVVINDCKVYFTKDGKKATQHYNTPDLKQIKIPDEFATPGTLEIEVDILSHGLPVRRHYVEPITFAAVDEGYKGHLEYERLLEKIAELENTVKEQAEQLAAHTERLDTTEDEIRRIWEASEL